MTTKLLTVAVALLCALSCFGCKAKDPDKCQATEECSISGFCKSAGDGCVASDEGCRQSQACKDMGWCAVDGQLCVSPADAELTKQLDKVAR